MKVIEQEIATLKNSVSEMWSLVHQQIYNAGEAMLTGDRRELALKEAELALKASRLKAGVLLPATPRNTRGCAFTYEPWSDLRVYLGCCR